MEIDKLSGKPTHVRVIDSNGKQRSLAIVIASNPEMMEIIGFRIEDPEYDLYLGGSKEIEEPKKEIELFEEVEEIEVIQEIQEVPKKRGRKSNKN